jgi:single-stranded DNA-binding protein
MSATVLISGKLWRDPERKLTKAGKPYAIATIRDGQGDEATWWRLFAFSEASCAELLGLHDGDAVAASGNFKAEVYDGRDGARISLTVLADRVISATRQKRDKARIRQTDRRSTAIDANDSQRPFDDEVGL